MNAWDNQLDLIFENAKVHINKVLPSEWYEKHMVMPQGSAFPGKFSFKRTPYWIEPLNRVDPLDPSREITIMKGAQLGGTTAVLNPIIGYTIANYPGNTMLLTGHSDLSEKAMLKVDQMIDNCGIRYLIQPAVKRKNNSRSGDTSKQKEFPGGKLIAGSVTNHNLLRQEDIMIMIVDDFDAAPMFSKDAGSTRSLVQKRTSAYANKKKIYYVSSPQLKNHSNIEAVFLLGDQRYYHVPCPKCGDHIPLKWEVEIDGTDGKEKGGIYYKVKDGRVIEDSVGYVCQSCGGFFDETHKYEMNLAGFWVPTAEPKEKNHYSYHLNSLYSPPGMDGWAHYAQQYETANPQNQKRDERQMQTFYNVVLGETYEQKGEEPKANQLQKNIRNYEIDLIPEKMSMNEGNGAIVLITCGADLNGIVDDARLDYEVVAWTESGSSYSLRHGSIGTFIPRENSKKIKKDRSRWTYEHGRENSVWPEFNKVLDQVFETDTGRKMRVFLTGIDTGHYTNYAYHFIDNSNFNVCGLKGKDQDKFLRYGIDIPTFKQARERGNLYLVEVNYLKDKLAKQMKLNWDSGNEYEQPPGFMNFPIPSNGLYLYENFFSHFESEHRVTDNKDNNEIAARWIKKTSISQNHFWDCRIYNMVLKDIMTYLLCREMKIKNPTWKDYVEIIMQAK